MTLSLNVTVSDTLTWFQCPYSFPYSDLLGFFLPQLHIPAPAHFGRYPGLYFIQTYSQTLCCLFSISLRCTVSQTLCCFGFGDKSHHVTLAVQAALELIFLPQPPECHWLIEKIILLLVTEFMYGEGRRERSVYVCMLCQGCLWRSEDTLDLTQAVCLNGKCLTEPFTGSKTTQSLLHYLDLNVHIRWQLKPHIFQAFPLLNLLTQHSCCVIILAYSSLFASVDLIFLNVSSACKLVSFRMNSIMNLSEVSVELQLWTVLVFVGPILQVKISVSRWAECREPLTVESWDSNSK